MSAVVTASAWPAALDERLSSSLVCEYASLTRAGTPVTWAVTPYVGDGTLDISTGLSYPDKAERARRNPEVALLFSDPTGSTSRDVVLVQGRAAVRDRDLQANTDRYVAASLARTTGFKGMPWPLVRRMGWYFARIWVEVTPHRVLWWPDGDQAAAPREWRPERAPAPTVSDPAPTGKRLASRTTPPVDWRPFAERAERLGAPVVTGVVDGRPLPLKTRSAERTAEGFRVTLPVGLSMESGPVCLTFHQVGEGLQWQENVVLLGSAEVRGEHAEVRIERALNDWSLSGRRLERMRAFTGPGKVLRQRLEHEAARRGQSVPVVNRPG